jgi:NCS1 family nucleobase:cation symporter-1
MADVAAKGGMEKSAIHQAAEGSWPVLPKERNWGLVGIFGVTISAGIAAWSYSIGGAVSWYLAGALGTIAMLAGSLVGMYFVTLAAMPVSVKYGIDTIASCKPQYGNRGFGFGIFAQYTSIVGWNCILIILFGRAAANVLNAGGWLPDSWVYTVSVLISLATIAYCYYLVIGGADSIRDNSVWIAVAVTIAGIIVLVRLLQQYGWHDIATAKPAYASGDLHLDYTLGFEILVATVLSWWPYMGGIMRMSKSVKQALFPSMICLGMITGIIGLIGLYAGLATGNSDPSISFVKVTGLWMGIIAVVFIALANIGTAIVGVYATCIGLKQIPALQYRLTWKWTAAIVLAPVAFIAAFLPNPFMSHILTFMYFLGLIFAPICAIGIVDYYLFRRQKLDMVALFDNSTGSKYGFWAGINPAAFAAVATGFFTYWFLLDPVTYVSHWTVGFKWISASLPSLVTSAVVYWAVTRLVVIPLKKGGYERYNPEPAVAAPTSAVPVSQPAMMSTSGPGEPGGGTTPGGGAGTID